MGLFQIFPKETRNSKYSTIRNLTLYKKKIYNEAIEY